MAERYPVVWVKGRTERGVWDWWQRDSGAKEKAWLSARGGASGPSSREDAAGKDETAGDG